MKQTFRNAALAALFFMSVACAKEEQQNPSIFDHGDEISTLTFGLLKIRVLRQLSRWELQELN